MPRRGWVQLKAIPWGGGTSSSSSAETINDGQFHTVELVTFDQMVNLSIDGGSPMTMDNFGKHYTLNSEAPLYVGGEDLAWVELQLALPGPLHQVVATDIPGGASVALWPEPCQAQENCPVGDIPRWQWGRILVNGQAAGGLSTLPRARTALCPAQTDKEGWECGLGLRPGLGGGLDFPSCLLHGRHLSSWLRARRGLSVVQGPFSGPSEAQAWTPCFNWVPPSWTYRLCG